jgi:hypothetical protein
MAVRAGGTRKRAALTLILTEALEFRCPRPISAVLAVLFGGLLDAVAPSGSHLEQGINLRQR